jgi:hypothetical protein
MLVEEALLASIALGLAVWLVRIAVRVADALHALPRLEQTFWGLATPAVVIAEAVDADESCGITAGESVVTIRIRDAGSNLVVVLAGQFRKQADRRVRTAQSRANHENQREMQPFRRGVHARISPAAHESMHGSTPP